MRRMADVFGSQSGRGDPPDGDHPAAGGQGFGEGQASGHLIGRRRAVRGRGAGMGRDDVPEQHLVGQPQFGKNAVDDRRCRLGRPRSRQLAFGGERDPGDPGAAVARRLADQQKWGPGSGLEVGGEAGTAERRTVTVTVEIRRLPDPGSCERADE